MKNNVIEWFQNTALPFMKKRPIPVAIVVALLAFTAAGSLLRPSASGVDTAFHTIEERDFLVSVVEGGEMQSVNETVIRSEVDGSARIIYIVPEGTTVAKGDLLVELDASELDDLITQKKIDVEQSRALVTQAEANKKIVESQIQSNIRDAEVALLKAQLTLEKFDSMEATNMVVQANLDLVTAEESLKLAEEQMLWTERLAKDGFETQNKLDQDRFTFTNRFFDVTKASNQVEMLRAFDLRILRSDYELQVATAKDALDRVKLEGEGQLAKEVADLASQQAKLELSESQLEKLLSQMDNSKIYAPEPGLVVYAVSENRWSSETMIEEGATVRNRQELIKLPDTTKMKVKLQVAESNIGQISVGQLAYVVIESMPDKRFRGSVSRVAPVPAAGSRFMGGNMKRYDTEVIIEEEIPDVKPGVTAQAEIIVTNLEDTLVVPNQCITMADGDPVVYRDGFGGPKPVAVELGLYDAQFTQVVGGLKKGDKVLLTPPINFDSDDLNRSVVREGDDSVAEDLESRPQPKPGESAPGSGGGARGQGGQPGSGQGGAGAGGFDREAMMKQLDTDGDGEISESEREAARARFQSSGGGGGGRPGGGGGRPAGGPSN